VKPLTEAIRLLEGGRRRFLELTSLAVANHGVAASAWWEVFQTLNAYQMSKVSFDDVCAASGVKPSDLMSEVISAAMTLGTEVADLVQATMHPQVVSQMTKSAMRITGKYVDTAQKDRFAMLQHSRWLPVPKGASIVVNANSSANSKAAAAAAQEPSMPSFDEDVASLQESRAAVQRQLASAVDAEVED
jgi:hypothetical protein